MARTADINPRVLSWARETAGLSLEEAAAKLGLKDTAGVTAAEKLLQAESGSRGVSQSMLEKAATTYHRPLIAFYLPQPPVRGERLEDFRTAAGTAASPRENALLDALVRDVRTRQQMLRDALLEDEDTQPLPFVSSCRMVDGPQHVAAQIRSQINVTTEQQRRAKDPAALFSLLRGAAEKSGVFVLLLGDLGSHHSGLGDEVFRGMALADDIAPFVIINDNDATPARSFTLLHELAHIWIGASGVSGPLQGIPTNAIERFCNAVAGEFLLPPDAMSKLPLDQAADFDGAMSLTNDIARPWNVSQGVATYRLLLSGWLSDDLAATMFRTFTQRWRAQKLRERQAREPDEGGPTYYVVRRSRLGNALLSTVRRALESEALTHTRAARILGVAPAAVDQLLLRGRQHAA